MPHEHNPLDPAHVPEALRRWLPLAERWGIGDDYERDHAVRTASPAELQQLLSFADDYDTAAAWLAGPESYSPQPTREYIAFSDLAMAWELARLLSTRHESA